MKKIRGCEENFGQLFQGTRDQIVAFPVFLNFVKIDFTALKFHFEIFLSAFPVFTRNFKTKIAMKISAKKFSHKIKFFSPKRFFGYMRCEYRGMK